MDHVLFWSSAPLPGTRIASKDRFSLTLPCPMLQISKTLLVASLALGCVAARATAYADLPVCRPDYRAVVVSDSAALVREVTAQLQAKFGTSCPAGPSSLSPEAAQQLLADSLGAKYNALIDARELSVFIESVP